MNIGEVLGRMLWMKNYDGQMDDNCQLTSD